MVRHMQGDRCLMVLQLLAVDVRAARVAAELDAYGKERATDIIDRRDQ